MDVVATGALRLERLRKTFTSNGEHIVAVDNIDLDVEPGEFITLLGPSGCGKTTTLRMIAGFEHPTSGHIRLDGRTLDRVPPQRRSTAMVFQSFALFPHLTVADNIAYGLQRKRLTRSEIAEAIQLAITSMDIVKLAARRPHELSGGEQQRVALARALVVQPAVLLFDEPLSNLDAKLRSSMRAEIRRIQRRRGITSLYVTHDQDEAMSLSDRIVVMNKGCIEQVGTAGEIYLRPVSVFVANFVGRANFLTVSPRRVGDGNAVVPAFGGELVAACHENVRVGAAAYLMVRPESMALTPTADGADGTVLSSAFHGATAEYEIETSTGTLNASVPCPHPTGLLADGTHVRVKLDECRVYVLCKP